MNAFSLGTADPGQRPSDAVPGVQCWIYASFETPMTGLRIALIPAASRLERWLPVYHPDRVAIRQ